jgi:hypothetical protein
VLCRRLGLPGVATWPAGAAGLAAWVMHMCVPGVDRLFRGSTSNSSTSDDAGSTLSIEDKPLTDVEHHHCTNCWKFLQFYLSLKPQFCKQ